MSAGNQHTTRVSRARLRQWQKRFDQLLDDQEKIEEGILLSIHEASQEGLSNAAIGGMLKASPSGVPAKVAKAEKLLAERKGKNRT